jgi:hypothetical protein
MANIPAGRTPYPVFLYVGCCSGSTIPALTNASNSMISNTP